MNEFTHEIDWDRVHHLSDLINIIKTLDLKFDKTKMDVKFHKYLKPIEK